MMIHPNWPCNYPNNKEESFIPSNTEDEISNTEDEISTNKVYFSDTSLLSNFDKLLLSLLDNALAEISEEKSLYKKLNKKLSGFS
jgi:hypothetical protein